MAHADSLCPAENQEAIVHGIPGIKCYIRTISFECHPPLYSSAILIQRNRLLQTLSTKMRFSVLALFIPVALAAGTCDIEACRDVINGTACYAMFLSGDDKDAPFQCVTGGKELVRWPAQLRGDRKKRAKNTEIDLQVSCLRCESGRVHYEQERLRCLSSTRGWIYHQGREALYCAC